MPATRRAGHESCPLYLVLVGGAATMGGFKAGVGALLHVVGQAVAAS
jgi:hypothetical protein